MDLFNYDTSWLNPALKIVIAVGYLVVAAMYIKVARYFKGDLHKWLTVLVWVGVIGSLTAIIRYFGDGTQFGFTKSYSLKWFQSLGNLAQAIVFTIMAWKFSKGKIIPDLRDQ